MTLETLFELIQPYIEQPELIQQMAAKAKSLAVNNAAEQVAKHVAAAV